MTENTEHDGNFLDYLVESFWASLPEETAAGYAQCKKDTLTWVKATITSLVDTELNQTEEHMKNAQKMRDAHCKAGPSAADDAQPV